MRRQPTRARLVVGGVLLVLGSAAAGFAVGRSSARTPGSGPAGAPAAAPLPPAPPPPPSPGGAHGVATRSLPATRAIARGLAWLARAQEPDGSWDLAKWNPHHGKTGLHGFTEEDHWFAPAATGLAALAFLETQPPGTAYPPALVKALDRIVAFQREDGRIGFDERKVDQEIREQLRVAGFDDPGGPGYKARTLHSFNHAVPAAALAVAARDGREARWKEAARRAIAHLVADRHPEYRWTDYYDPEGDIGVVAYVVLAARAGADAGLVESNPLLESAPDFLDRVTDAEAGRTRMQSEHPACFDGDDSTAINAYCRRLLGRAADATPLPALLGSLCRADPAWKPAALPPATGVEMFHAHLGAVVNHDAFTYGVKASAGVTTGRPREWREAVRGLLIRNQVAEGEQEGSWEPIGVWDRVGGRVYSTAMAVRALGGP